MKNYSDKMREYEKEKQKLLESCINCGEYERKLAELAKRLGV